MNPTPYIVVGRQGCSWCEKAMEFLRLHGANYVYYDLTINPQTLEFLKLMGCKTVPLIWYGNELVGGYEELKEWLGPHD